MKFVPALLVSLPFVPALALHAQTTQPFGPSKHTSLDAPKIGTDRVMSSATSLTFATHAPGDVNRLFVLEKRGRIMILDLNTQVVNATPFLDIDSRVVNGGSEWGLLGLAFHPDYANNGLFYVDYSRNGDAAATIAEYKVTANPDVADFASERVLMTIDDLQFNHNAGWLGFGPLDGYLYIAEGDGGNACDMGAGHTTGTGNAQDISTNMYGKLLRIDPLGGVPYGIPSTNPFVGIAGDDEIWAYGLRNPWRASFDDATGDLYIGDVGQDIREEIDYQPAASLGGENYGWRCREGTACATVGASGCPVVTGCVCPGPTPGLTGPIHEYSHSHTSPICAVIGGYVYRGQALPEIDGHYFFADYCGNMVWGFRVFQGEKKGFREWTKDFSPSIDGFAITAIQSFGEDGNGEVYIVTASGVFKIVPRP